MAEYDGSITLSVGIDDGNVIKNLKTQMKEVGKAFGNNGSYISKALRDGNSKAAELAVKFQNLNSQIAEQTKKIELLKNKLDELQSGKGNASNPKIEKLKSDLEKTRAEIKKTDAETTSLLERIQMIEDSAFRLPETNEPVLTRSQQKDVDALYSKYDALSQKLRESKDRAGDLEISLKRATGAATQAETLKTKEQLNKANAELSSMRANAAKTGAQLKASMKKASKPISEVKNRLKETAFVFGTMGRRIFSLAKSALVFSVITRGLTALRESIGKVLKSSDQFNQALSRLKAALWTLAAPIYNYVIPALTKLVNFLTSVVMTVINTINSLLGKSTSEQIDQAKALQKTTAAYGSMANEVKKANKQLAAFDELNILSSNQDAESSAGSDNSDNGVKPDFDSLADGDFDTSSMSSKLRELMEVIGGCLIAVGIILLFTGHIGWGIGFIIAGVAAFAVAESDSDETDPTATPKEKLLELAAVVGAAMAVLGVIMIFFGNYAIGIGAIIAGITLLGVGTASVKEGGVAEKIKKFMKENEDAIIMASFVMLIMGVLLLFVPAVKTLALGLIAAGVVGLASEVALNEGSISEKISKFLDDNAELIICASLVFLVLGIIFCLFGIKLPLAIGMIALGVAGLVTEAVLHWDLIKEKISSFFKENAALVVGISLAFLVFGIILCLTGVSLPIGIALIVVGIAGLVTEVVLHWDFIKEKISSFFKENAAFATVGSIAMLVLGIVLVCTGVGLPIGIALILAGVAGLVTTVVFNKDAILEKIKSVWKSITDFWNKHIAPVFTAKWWGDLAKNAINGFLEWIFNGLNSLIRKLNSFGFDLPEVLGGGRVGFNLSEFTIPKLAKGGIVPYATTAVIGEAGREAVLPLENNTEWMDMLADRIALRSGGSGQITTVILELDGRELGRAVVNAGNQETRRIGTRLVVT